MYYLIIKNIQTGHIATISVFQPVAVNTVIGWGTDDGETIAQWKVEYCKKA